MRYMVMHKVDPNMEAGGPPDASIITSMGALVQESLKSGVFLTGAGLHRSAKRARVEARAGKVEVEHGPYAGKNELVASFLMTRAASLEAAVDQARGFALASGDLEVEVGPVVEPWDIGVMPKPETLPPGRFLLLFKGDAEYERGAPPPGARTDADRALTQELRDKDQLLASGQLAPSLRAARLAAPREKRTWVDGPFAESKELIAGFSILEQPSRADAIAWAERYAAILTINEIDVRELLND